MEAQQARFDAFVEEFNNESPHEALGNQPPHRCSLNLLTPFRLSVTEAGWFPGESTTQDAFAGGTVGWYTSGEHGSVRRSDF